MKTHSVQAWCLFCICVSTMSSFASYAVATYTYDASREAWQYLGSTYLVGLRGGMKLNSKVNMTNILYIFFSKRHKSCRLLENLGFFHENTWCLFWICVATMSSLASHAVHSNLYLWREQGSMAMKLRFQGHLDEFLLFFF